MFESLHCFEFGKSNNTLYLPHNSKKNLIYSILNNLKTLIGKTLLS